MNQINATINQLNATILREGPGGLFLGERQRTALRYSGMHDWIIPTLVLLVMGFYAYVIAFPDRVGALIGWSW
jgi:hypothetical protein